MLCFLAIRELGITATELARQMGLTPPAIGMSVERGERIVKEKKIDIEALFNYLKAYIRGVKRNRQIASKGDMRCYIR